jgi:AcrR family transcriptional regulator
MSTDENGGTTRRRRERPAQPALTRRGIIDVALTILRDEGLNKVTMRRIAAALDTGAASLYVYVHSTEDLHAQILDALLGSISGSVPADQTWRERLSTLLWSYTRLLFDYPEIARMAMSTQPSGPNYLALVDTILALLHEGGVSDRQAAWAVDLLLLYATAIAAEHSTRRSSPQEVDERSALALAIAMADAVRYPHIARLGDELLSGDGRARHQWALDVLIDGVLHTRSPLT